MIGENVTWYWFQRNENSVNSIAVSFGSEDP